MNANVLEIRNLSKSFAKNEILSSISLSLRRGSVMALIGENGAGKSTLMKCLFGIYAKDSGHIILDGKPVEFKNPKDALEHGIAMVHQELSQCLDLTVMDNLFLGRFPVKFGIIDNVKMYKACTQLFKLLGIGISPNIIMRKLGIAQRQIVEIAKAVSLNAKIIVLDEPTTPLSEPEVSKLFAIIRRLKEKGVSFIYISHKIDEIFQICDEISVIRDGRLVLAGDVHSISMDDVFSAMAGRTLNKRFPQLDNTPGEDYLEVRDLSTEHGRRLHGITFTVRKGEIFGLYGLEGAGRSELLECLFGLRSMAAGEIILDGRKLFIRNSRDAMECNFALVTEERMRNGLFASASITFNTVITNLDCCKTAGALSRHKMREAARREIRRLHIRCHSQDEAAGTLSGGNQQKVIIGKWLERKPDILLLDEPTRGIDVGAKYEIYELIGQLAKEGKTIIVSSSEIPEVLGITNRIAVLSRHRLAGIVNTKDTSQEDLLRLSEKYL
ncbi:MAG: sugar ABC transporter ATP-binding protein [Treponema sp.]|nr:sugar ABC transporter ATP-binding protein [Treponema sp.]